jgi:hypothetical protein
VLLTNGELDNVRLLAHWRVAEVVFISELHSLPNVIDRVSCPAPFELAMCRVKAAHNLPVLLKRALLYVLEQEPSHMPLDPGDQAAPVRTLAALAKLMGVTPDYLSRLASKNGIRLARFIDYCVAMRALYLTRVQRVPLEQAAWRLGVSGADALSGHIVRAIGVRPSKVVAEDLPNLFARLHDMLDGNLT